MNKKFFIPQVDQFDLISRRRLWYILSLVIIIPGTVSFFVRGVNLGIDFKGGVLQQVTFEKTQVGEQTLRDSLTDLKVKGLSLQTAAGNQVFLRYPQQEGEATRDTGNRILSKLTSAATAKETAFESIGGSVAKATTISAIWSVVLASLAILVFIAWSFRAVPKPASAWRFGTTAIVALLHDLLFVLGMFSLLGIFFPSIEVDSLFITAILTVLGFSLNDTIVVYDRIRENLTYNPEQDFEKVANDSLNQTVVRSLNTSFTVLIVLISLLVLGGESIRNFILALTLGVGVGTYSSIFTAAPLLVTWQYWAERRAAKLALNPPKKKETQKPAPKKK